MKRGIVFFLVGLILGTAGALVYAWLIDPVAYYDTTPPLMRADYQETWIRLSVLAYGAEGAMERTRLRLSGLPEARVRAVLERTLEDVVAEGRPLTVLQRIAELAKLYGLDTTSVRIYTDSGEFELTPDTVTLVPFTPTPSATPSPLPSPTLTLRPTLTHTPSPPTPKPTFTASPVPSPTPTRVFTSPYRLLEQSPMCKTRPVITLTVVREVTQTVRGREQLEQVGVPGLEVWLLWDDGADHAITGLRPDEGLGYADFAVEPERTYNLYLASPMGVPVASLHVRPCTGTEQGAWMGWSLLILQQVP